MAAQDDEDLWPADITEAPYDKTPLEILKEQGAALARKTGDLIDAELTTAPDLEGNGLVLRFTLVAPKLSNYRYDLLTAVQGGKPYPVKLILDGYTYVADSENALKVYLRNFFASHTTRKVISSLVAQSRAASA